MNLNGSRNFDLFSWVSSVGSGISVFKKKTRHLTRPSRFLVKETRLRLSPALGRSVFGSAREVWAGGSVPGLAWTPLSYTYTHGFSWVKEVDDHHEL